MNLLKNPAVNKILAIVILVCLVFLLVDFFLSKGLRASVNSAIKSENDRIRFQMIQRDNEHMERLLNSAK